MNLPQSLIIESQNQEIGFTKAITLAKNNLCLRPIDGKSCNICQSCNNFDNKNHPDIIFIERPNDKKNISVDIVRNNFIRKINSKPLLSKISVVLIKEAQTLSIAAQNAILKTLEEPPIYLKILLTVDNSSHLLDTIISRGQILKITTTDKFDKERYLTILKEIIFFDVPERFAYVSQISDKDKKEERKDSFYTLEFIDMLIIGLRNLLRDNINDVNFGKKAIKDIDKILEERDKILYNTNKLLVLENIMLQTLDQDIYKDKI
jgi:DNA polymerase-3 subunit delta'